MLFIFCVALFLFVIYGLWEVLGTDVFMCVIIAAGIALALWANAFIGIAFVFWVFILTIWKYDR